MLIHRKIRKGGISKVNFTPFSKPTTGYGISEEVLSKLSSFSNGEFEPISQLAKNKLEDYKRKKSEK
jgi:hypothetical protein